MKPKNVLLTITAIGMIVLVLILTGCLRENQDSLRGTNWVLKEINGIQPMNGTTLTIEFIDGRISGSAGCNHFGGDYNINGDEILFESIYNTEMACMDPDGVMGQEKVYLETLSSAVRFTQTGKELVIFDNADGYLKFETYNSSTTSVTSGDQDDTVQIEAPTEIPDVDALPTEGPPWEYNVYQDPDTGITIFLPEDWIVTGIIEGDYAILQSYSEDKYIGGEMFEPGDTKCDLNIQAEGTRLEDLLVQWKNDESTTIEFEEELVLNSGLRATKLGINSMGQSTVMITEINQWVVVFACFGNTDLFDEIAKTIDINEVE